MSKQSWYIASHEECSEYCSDWYKILISSDEGEGVCLVWDDEEARDQCKRHAHMIEATPDLLEACKAAKDLLDHPEQKSRRAWQVIEQLDAAIAKAEPPKSA